MGSSLVAVSPFDRVGMLGASRQHQRHGVLLQGQQHDGGAAMRCVWGNCDQQADPSGLCYYHQKVGLGLLDSYQQPNAKVRALIEELREKQVKND